MNLKYSWIETIILTVKKGSYDEKVQTEAVELAIAEKCHVEWTFNGRKFRAYSCGTVERISE